MFYVLLPDRAGRDGLMDYLRQQNIFAVFHYLPLHASPMGQRLGYEADDLPITNDISSRLLRLPFFYEITEAEQSLVVQQIRAFLKR